MKLQRFKTILNNRRYTAIILVVVLGISVAPFVHAQNVIANSVFLILDNILMGMIKLFASLTGIFVSLLVVVARYNTFLNAPVVEQGWPIVRDLMNMVFIIGLLMISAGTVLRLQNYRYNQLLGKLIMMAFLVNFSKFIAVFLLQFGQVVMLTFINAFRDVAFGNFSHMFGLDAVLNFANSDALTQANDSNKGLSVFVTLLAGLIMMLVAFVVMLAITVILFVRIIALWLLIILSPLAYALRVLPQTEKYASQWWSEFTKYVVVGPVLAFFLWIALALVGSGNCTSNDINQKCTGNPISQADDKTKLALVDAEKDTATLRGDFISEALSLDRMMTFIVGIIFLMMGLQYAQKSGTAGASFAGKVASAGFGAAATLTGLNAIRDRTIAPIQGYLKERQSRRNQGISERVTGLSARVDQGLSNTVGRVGRVRAAAGGALGAATRGVGQIATGQRTVDQVSQQVTDAAQLGMQQGTRSYRQSQGRIANWQAGTIDREVKEKNLATVDPATLEQMRSSGNGAVSMAAELTALSRGTMKLDTSTPDGLASLNNLLGAAQSVKNNPELRKRYQDNIEKALKRPSTSEDALTHIFDNVNGSNDDITRLDAGEELANRRLLNATRAKQVNDLANVVSADKATAFRKALYAKQSDLAIETFHNNLADKDKDVPSLLSAIERGEARQDIIKQKHIANDDVRKALGQGVVNMHLAKGTPDKISEGFSEQVRSKLFNDIEIDGTVDSDERAKIANATGAAHKVFRNSAGFMATEFGEYIQRNAKVFAEKVNANAFDDELDPTGMPYPNGKNDMVDAMSKVEGLYASHFREMAKRGATMYKPLSAALEKAHARSVDANGGVPEFNKANKAVYNTQQRLRTGTAITTRSEKLLWDPTTSNGQKSLDDFISSAEGGELGSIHESDPYKNPATKRKVQDSVVRNLNADEVPKFVSAAGVTIAREVYKAIHPSVAATPLGKTLADNSHTARLIT